MNSKQFRRYLDRDTGACYHCGISDDTLVPGHRLGRGIGGSSARNVPSNIVTMCAEFNNRIEIDADTRALARRLGLSLTAGQNPAETPVWNISWQRWVILDNQFGVTVVEGRKPSEHLRDGATAGTTGIREMALFKVWPDRQLNASPRVR